MAICRAVLSFPQTLAATTCPCSTASWRSPVTANSRAMKTIATHACRRSSETRRDERRRDEELVRQRIHELAERRHVVVAAREVPGGSGRPSGGSGPSVRTRPGRAYPARLVHGRQTVE